MKFYKNNRLKNFTIISICLLIVTSCVPAGGGTNPSATFNVNLVSHSAANTSYKKAVLVDGDSLVFLISDLGYTMGSFANLFIYYKQSASNNYQFLCADNNRSYGNEQGLAFLPFNVTINNNTDTIYINDTLSTINNTGNKIYWANSFNSANSPVSLFNQYQYIPQYEDTFNLNRFNYAFGITRYSTWNPLISGTITYPFFDFYIVFRKLKPSGYQYYWVKCKTDFNIITPVNISFSILNGKYQSNTITTGL